MPIGYLITVGVVAVGLLLALAPLRRSGGLGTLSWFLSAVVNGRVVRIKVSAKAIRNGLVIKPTRRQYSKPAAA